MAYPLSVGPAIWLVGGSHYHPNLLLALEAFYSPLFYAAEHSHIVHRILEKWISCFV